MKVTTTALAARSRGLKEFIPEEVVIPAKAGIQAVDYR
jgi:hypothetical protein